MFLNWIEKRVTSKKNEIWKRWQAKFSTKFWNFEYSFMTTAACNAHAAFQTVRNELHYDSIDETSWLTSVIF